MAPARFAPALRPARAAAAALALLLIAGPAAAQEEIEEVSDLDLEALLEAPLVESASKRQQSLEEAPSSITVLTGTAISDTGAVTLADVLRTVPGLWIYHTDANMFHVGVRGLGMMTSASTLVLLNGRRFYDVTVGFAPWTALPVHAGEIERIEILRGPGASLHGADAFNGVINIVTKRPKDHRGFEGTFGTDITLLPHEPGTPGRQRLGNGGSGYLAFNHRSDDGKLAWRAAFGLDQIPEWQDIDTMGKPDVYRFGRAGYHAGVTADWVPSRDLSAWLDARHVLSERQVSFPNTPQTTQTVSEQSATLALEKKRFLTEGLTLKLSGDARREHQQGRPVGLDRLLVRVNGYHLLAQGDLTLAGGADVLTAVAEGGYRTGGFFTDIHFRQRYGAVVLQNEAALFDRRLVLNVVGRYERIDQDNELGSEARYVNFNPRVSIIGRLSKRHTVRASAATSYRAPTPFHTFANILPDTSYPPGVPPAYAVVGNPSLEPEQLRAVEVGYRGRLAYWLRFEATLYAQRATSLLLTSLNGLPFVTHNERGEDQFGLETAAQLRSTGTLAGYVNYSFLESRPRGGTEGMGFPAHLLAAGVSDTLAGIRLRADFNYAAAVTHQSFDATTLLVGPVRIPPQYNLNVRAGRTVLNGAAELFVMGTNVLAGLRSRSDLHQYSNSTAAPIGTVVMIGAEVSGP